MIVLHVTESFGGGVAAAVRDYQRNAPEHSHHLLYSEREDAPVERGLLSDFASVEKLPRGTASRLKVIRSRIRALGASLVVHAHSSFAGVYVRLAVRRDANVQIIYTPHCFAFERKDLGAPASLAYLAIESLLSFNTTAFAACSPREAALARRLLGRRTAIFVPNTAPRVKTRGCAAAKTGSLVLAGAGRLGKQKDPEFFVECVREVRSAGFEVDAVWVGGGDEGTQQLLEDAGIRVTGWISREDVLSALSEADIYVHTAAWEGFPIAILEVDQLGVPVLVRDIPAFRGVNFGPRFATPSELARMWSQIETPEFRNEIVSANHLGLSGFSDAAQSLALERVYGGRYRSSARRVSDG